MKIFTNNAEQRQVREELLRFADRHPWEILSGRFRVSEAATEWLVSCDPCFEDDSEVRDFLPTV
jgi:hypothetical protein